MAVRAYAGTARPVDSVYEGRAGFRVVEVDATDGSLDRGYQEIATGKLCSLATMVVSPARQAALDAINADATAEAAQIANFRQSIRDLAVKVKNNTATAAEQRQLLVKLSRVADGVLADLP
jgi:hypothetical protein